MSPTIDAVLPLTLKDYGRFEILYRSIKKNFIDLGTFWIIVIDKEYDEIKSRIKDKQFQVINESSIVPEFKLLDELNIWRTPGWFAQQLIKIAIASRIGTDFYITFDADVICVKPTQITDLIEKDKAICCLHPASRKWFIWYEWAERVLKLHNATGLFHNFTPAVLSRDGMLKMQDYLSEIATHPDHLFSLNKKVWLYRLAKAKLLTQGQQEHLSLLNSWRAYLIKNLPWTEYALYYSFLENMGLFDQYHILRQDHHLYTMEKSVWNTDYWNNWQPEKVFSDWGVHHFCIVQSNIGVEADAVWDKVHSYLA